MKYSDNILYYSVNSKIAYYLNEVFYKKHFVWCSPVFDTSKLDSLDPNKKIPPSSNPYTIYGRLKQDVENADLHSGSIIQNTAGLKKGAVALFNGGIIDDSDFAKINAIIDLATINEFSPLLYIIPGKEVEKRIIEVPVDKMANPLSTEYQIHDLTKHEFQVVEF